MTILLMIRLVNISPFQTTVG